MFFALQPSKAILSDANEHLIMTYKYVRDKPDLIHDYLREHARNDCEKYYYQIRELYNKSRFSVAQAARFIYMNKLKSILTICHWTKTHASRLWKKSSRTPVESIHKLLASAN